MIGRIVGSDAAGSQRRAQNELGRHPTFRITTLRLCQGWQFGARGRLPATICGRLCWRCCARFRGYPIASRFGTALSLAMLMLTTMRMWLLLLMACSGDERSAPDAVLRPADPDEQPMERPHGFYEPCPAVASGHTEYCTSLYGDQGVCGKLEIDGNFRCFPECLPGSDEYPISKKRCGWFRGEPRLVDGNLCLCWIAP